MTALNAMQALAAGDSSAKGALLQTCRLAVGGSEFFGEEEIVAWFRGTAAITDEPQSVSSASHAALFWTDTALFADVAGDHIARLGLLGPGKPVSRELSVAVPFDANMQQWPGDPAFSAHDHPELSLGDVGPIMQAGRELERNWQDASGQPALRARAFAIRAFSTGSTCAALFAVHVLAASAPRRAGFVHVAALIGGNSRLIRDDAAECALDAEWHPTIG